MKKRAFAIFFILLCTLVLYSNPSPARNDRTNCRDYDVNSCPYPDCIAEIMLVPVGLFGCLGIRETPLCITNSLKPCEEFELNECPPDCIIETETIPVFFGYLGTRESRECITNPPANSSEISQEYCFPENTQGLVDSPSQEITIPAAFIYEGVETSSWEFLINSEFSEILAGVLRDPGIREKITLPFYTNTNMITEHCRYHYFSFIRQPLSLAYQLPLSSETDSGDGTKYCIYELTDEVVEDLIFVSGKPVGSVDEICPELREGKRLPENQKECPPTAECTVNILQGEVSYYGYLYEKDDCNKILVSPDNNGAPLEIDTKSMEERGKKLVDECSLKYSPSSFYITDYGIDNPEEFVIGWNKVQEEIINQEPRYESCTNESCSPATSLESCSNIKSVKMIFKEGDSLLAEKFAENYIGCIFETDIQIPENLLGKQVSISLEIELIDSSIKRVENLETKIVREDVYGPGLIKGISGMYTTLPVNFNLIATDENQITNAKVVLSTNLGESEIPLNIEHVHQETFVLKGVWNPNINPSNIQINEIKVLMRDNYNNPSETSYPGTEISLLNKEFECSRIRTASVQNPINIVFITHFYTDWDLANANFNLLPQTLLEQHPFNQHNDAFNYYLIKSNWGKDEFVNPYSLIQNECSLNVEEIHDVVNLINLIDRSHVHAGMQQLYTMFPSFYLILPIGLHTYVHESGHSFARLSDEYWAKSDNTHINFQIPGKTGDGNYNTDIEGCPKWCSGELNNSSPYYYYYSGWKDCVDLARSGIRTIEEMKNKDEELAQCWEEWDNRLKNARGISLSDIDLGKGCQENTGCFFTSHGVGKWRSIRRGIMYFSFLRYGPISEPAIEQRINGYLSRTLSPQKEIGSIAVSDGSLGTYSHNRLSAFYQSPDVIFVDEFNEDGQISGGKTIDLRALSYEKRFNLAEKKRAKDIAKGKVSEKAAPYEKIIVGELDMKDIISSS